MYDELMKLLEAIVSEESEMTFAQFEDKVHAEFEAGRLIGAEYDLLCVNLAEVM